jgi:hypothetical protein
VPGIWGVILRNGSFAVPRARPCDCLRLLFATFRVVLAIRVQCGLLCERSDAIRRDFSGFACFRACCDRHGVRLCRLSARDKGGKSRVFLSLPCPAALNTGGAWTRLMLQNQGSYSKIRVVWCTCSKQLGWSPGPARRIREHSGGSGVFCDSVRYLIHAGRRYLVVPGAGIVLGVGRSYHTRSAGSRRRAVLFVNFFYCAVCLFKHGASWE